MACIGQQRQRTGEEAADRLGHHEAARQQCRDQNALLVGAAQVMTVIVRGSGTMYMIVRRGHGSSNVPDFTPWP